ncbi:30S ribosomal protein S17 [Thermosipho melanesiensis]|uniref:Small ribosomal subunit protein uS17 n=2 Tax=Thermosipho melanesiensis TaxID=46541 RepID=RS17_THEM4|nr:30S ribosomal protein S17 [Thermosipho melanesiensis]A6LLM2.1 RecName: Full=Small ribosomal subunit protein uS17; AltName: Full=30S ribosomal protein S17 [Thermosipho melanesiensis BI429]ABR30823.1 ribosomal protein S17 [Thermosipho melanesiensis BI429]APT73943.1 30S ribosomal protein S17 [Thermosipho melanesiensis]OOC35880.1 30S ribosomal protein S17 [Thermosipho melanesiensis]OOC38382.1 30S ribosomal protein S17 [Thermosipho melanesiensis]OOC38843.1 30S ribosomal protein S17 [Thermosipho
MPKKRLIGEVLSDKMDKTVVVAVSTLVKHPRVGKYIKRTKKYYAHDENNECRVGDIVEIVESRPLSKLKRWKVERIVERSVFAEKAPEEDLEGGSNNDN